MCKPVLFTITFMILLLLVSISPEAYAYDKSNNISNNSIAAQVQTATASPSEISNHQNMKEKLTISYQKPHFPLIGEINPEKFSLLSLAVLLGLADGFNPCAMWVLLYLISLIMNVHSRPKIIWLVGTFVLSSGILYFLFMAAWLNVFFLLGYTKFITIAVGLLAIVLGLHNLYEIIASRGQIVCKVGDTSKRHKTKQIIERVVAGPINLAGIAGMIGLAFAVNSIEFICSSALPAIYTYMLSVSNLSTLQHYFYIFIYVFFFMLDDLIIFSLAIVASQKLINSRYGVYSRLIGGMLLIGIGLWMIFKKAFT